jgi:phage regulator Rha-like protein
MTDLMVLGKVKTMNSREIAELTGKEHRNVCRDIVEQLGKLEGGVLRFAHTYRNEQNGQEYPCYALPFRETMIVMSGYSVELRAKVIDRWMELERAAVPALPKTFAEALRLAADQAEKIEEQEKALAIAAPKVDSFDALQRSEKTMSITQAAKYFSLHPKTQVFPYLRERKYLTSKDIPSQDALDAKILDIVKTKGRDNEMYDQAVVRDWMLEKWRTVVVPNIKKWELEE